MLGSVDSSIEPPGPRIWAIGGGKGGVGKSVISTGIAMTLARQGQRCIMVDADLGGANLHTFLGMSHPKGSLSDLFLKKVTDLEEILQPSSFDNLSLISGARAMLDMANLNYLQKLKMIRQIFSLKADHIFIDLGAGSSYNVLDFFIAAHDGLMVVMPTPTSIENAYHFLRAVYFRKLRKVVRDLKAEQLVDTALSDKVKSGVRSPRELMLDLLCRDNVVGKKINQTMKNFSPQLIINQAQLIEGRELGRDIVLACREFFGIDVTLSGIVRTDDRVLTSLKAQRPVLDMFPNCFFAEDIRSIVQQSTYEQKA
ncbi:MAG TPA: P-loop NTPase [Geopsychrobacteraceae bacterium]|nr:P-loop NTPase [Geopsychrobacteraceae bacterium]